MTDVDVDGEEQKCRKAKVEPHDKEYVDRLFTMTKKFNLDFHGTTFPVPKVRLINLFEHQRGLFDATAYDVQSSVPLEIFELFVKALQTGGKVPVSKENSSAISLLAKEFWLEELLSECSALQASSAPELIRALSERITKLEDQMSSPTSAIIAQLKESLADHERQLESLACRISVLEPNLAIDLKDLKSVSPVSTPASVPPASPSLLAKVVEYSPGKAQSLTGIISYLTRKHGGNVHNLGIVTITSKSIDSDGLTTISVLADLSSSEGFFSNDAPGQWVCWDFHESRVRLTHYTIRCDNLKSWVIESSLDGQHWSEIHRIAGSSGWTHNHSPDAFPVSQSAESRFIRLTQTGASRSGTDCLSIHAFEMFGVLLESTLLVPVPPSIPPRPPAYGAATIFPVFTSPSLTAVEFPLNEARSVDGIISYLTRKHGGNVHDLGIVTITSKSLFSNQLKSAVRNAADFTSNSSFCSKNKPNQWICWNFHDSRIRPTHYTVRSDRDYSLTSWIVETSLDGWKWTEIDRRIKKKDLDNSPYMASFPVADSAECGFIRLEKLPDPQGRDKLFVFAFEVFGTLLD
jgi:hypothetical protein